MSTTRADDPSGTTYTAVTAAGPYGALCDWCDEPARVVVVGRRPYGWPRTWDRMCAQHLAEYHPTLTV